ncbi:MAG TPA: hypothetical protein VIY53_06615 [Acidobacteriaceae bacterium]
MSHSLSQMLAFPVVTADRRKAAIRSFLFDDQTWSIRYVVVDPGRHFPIRTVPIPVSALRTPDWSRGIIETDLSLEEVARSADAEEVRPVSRQRQLAWNKHFGWGNEDTYSDAFRAAFPRQEFRDVDDKDDPHLRASTDLISYQVWDSGESLGSLEDYFVDDFAWHIGYLLVRAGGWTYQEKFVPSSSVRAISWGQGRVVVGDANVPAEQAPQ